MRIPKGIIAPNLLLLLPMMAVPLSADSFRMSPGMTAYVSFQAPPADTSVPAGTTLTGHLSWSVFLVNLSDTETVFSPVIVLSSNSLPSISGGLCRSTDDPVSCPVNTTTPLPYTYSAPGLGLAPNGGPGSGFSIGWFWTDILRDNTPGFDSSVTVDPPVVPAGATVQQTVTVRVKPVDRRFDTATYVNVGVQGRCLRASVTPNINTVRMTCNEQGAGWTVEPASFNQEYAFRAVLSVTNTSPSAMAIRQQISAQMGTRTQTVDYPVAPGATIMDGTLLSAQFSVAPIVGQNNPTWSYGDTGRVYIVDYPVVWETPRDTTPPVISGMPAPGCALWPPNKKMVRVANVTATDAESGLGQTPLTVTGVSNEPSDPNDPDIVIKPNGSGGFSVELRAGRLGNGHGRVYTLTATAADLAGNIATATATCTVPHDQGKK